MNNNYSIKLKNIFGHFHTINKHRFKVFYLCCKVGIPLQGLVHDLSKYSPTEFFEGVKYYQGNYSPIRNCIIEEGYSKAWLHHKGRNKHHYEYWYDYEADIQAPIIPFKYTLELICDFFAAGMTYQKENWTEEYQLDFWNKIKDKAKLNPKMYEYFEKVFKEVSIKGLDKVLDRKYLKNLYDEYTK